jgi:uncharacterized protein CbrC (UPF0167 family)
LSLPVFKYHPDPLATGSIVARDTVCRCCGRARSHVYVGPVYAEDELDEHICPWCIADGSAHERLDASFTDHDGVGGYGDWDAVPSDVADEIAFRTPGFSGWQQERWWTHCGDAAAFLGRVGYKEASQHGPELLEALAEGPAFATAAERESYLRALDRDGSPTGYAFRCRHCGKLGGYSDRD